MRGGALTLVAAMTAFALLVAAMVLRDGTVALGALLGLVTCGATMAVERVLDVRRRFAAELRDVELEEAGRRRELGYLAVNRAMRRAQERERRRGAARSRAQGPRGAS